MAKHVEFKPQLKKQDGDGRDEESGAEADAKAANETGAGVPAEEEAELEEAASF